MMVTSKTGVRIARILRFFSLGLIALDRPRDLHVRRMWIVHRWLLGIEARWRGRRDGSVGIPQPETGQPPEICRLKQQGDGVLRRIAAQWAALDARLLGEWHALMREREHRARLILSGANELGDAEGRFEHHRERLDRSREADEERPADDRWRIGTKFYIPAILLIFLGEFPLNAVAFNLLGEDRIGTYIMTAGLAASLVLCAHGLGVIWRLEQPTPRDQMIGWALIFFPLATIISIGVIRELYIEQIGALVHLGLIGGTVFFVIMNSLIFLAAFVLSYFHHDPAGHMLEKLHKEVKRAERELRRRRRRFETHAWMFRWLTGRAELWHAARRGALRVGRFEALRHKDVYESLAESYWSANRQARERQTARNGRRYQRRLRWRGSRYAGDAPVALDGGFSVQKEEIQVPQYFRPESENSVLAVAAYEGASEVVRQAEALLGSLLPDVGDERPQEFPPVIEGIA
jgi:hypothetical protein